MEFNIIASVGTSEVDLAPHPNGSPTVPQDRVRKVKLMVLSNTAATSNTLTLRMYRGGALEKSIDVVLPPSDTKVIGDGGRTVLVVLPGRTLRAVASAASVHVLMTAEDVVE